VASAQAASGLWRKLFPVVRLAAGHQGLGQRVPGIDQAPGITAARLGTCRIRRKPVLNCLINEYERAA
jgi:hypothetical protein